MIYAQNLPGRDFVSEEKNYLYFSGTSYLGMATNPAFHQVLSESIARYGSNYSSSRNSNVQIDIFDQAEAFLAEFTGTEGALSVSSGFMAGQLLIRALEKSGTFFYAPNAHPAVTRNEDDFYTGSFNEWLQNLSTQIENSRGIITLVTNSVDPLYVNKYSFAWLNDLPENRNYHLIVDDSHGFGILGQDGNGIIAEINPPDHVQVTIIASMGKAFGIPGGVVLGQKDLIDKLRAHPFFGGSSPLIPAYLDAFLVAGDIYREARTKLWENIRMFSSSLEDQAKFKTFSRYPVFYTAMDQLYDYLLSQKIIISSFRYPTQYDDLVSRVVLNSNHTKKDIELLTSLINNYLKNPNDAIS